MPSPSDQPFPHRPGWVTVETHLWGKVVQLGGRPTPQVHVESEYYGSLTLSATEEQLAQETQNRLYQRHQVHARLFQHVFTAKYDTTGDFLGFVDYPDETVDEYLARLVKQVTPDLAKIKEPDAWLEAIRGYREWDEDW